MITRRTDGNCFRVSSTAVLNLTGARPRRPGATHRPRYRSQINVFTGIVIEVNLHLFPRHNFRLRHDGHGAREQDDKDPDSRREIRH